MSLLSNDLASRLILDGPDAYDNLWDVRVISENPPGLITDRENESITLRCASFQVKHPKPKTYSVSYWGLSVERLGRGFENQQVDIQLKLRLDGDLHLYQKALVLLNLSGVDLRNYRVRSNKPQATFTLRASLVKPAALAATLGNSNQPPSPALLNPLFGEGDGVARGNATALPRDRAFHWSFPNCWLKEVGDLELDRGEGKPLSIDLTFSSNRVAYQLSDPLGAPGGEGFLPG